MNVGGVDRIRRGELHILEKSSGIYESSRERHPIAEETLYLECPGEQYNKSQGMPGLPAPFCLEHVLILQVDRPVKMSTTRNNMNLEDKPSLMP